jgi:hypothetical protein
LLLASANRPPFTLNGHQASLFRVQLQVEPTESLRQVLAQPLRNSGDAEGTLASVGFGYPDTLHRLRAVASAVQACMEVDQSRFQPFAVVFPAEAIDATGRLAVECKLGFPEPVDPDVVHQPKILISPRRARIAGIQKLIL